MNKELPNQFEGPDAWVSGDLVQSPDSWLKVLSESVVSELEAAAKAYLATGKDIGEITADGICKRTVLDTPLGRIPQFISACFR